MGTIIWWSILVAIGFIVGVTYQGKKLFQKHMDILDEREEYLDENKIKLNQQEERLKRQWIEKNKELQQKIKNAQKELIEQQEQVNKQIQIAKKELQVTQDAEKAIERIINGYGDQYLIPSLQLIDELAEEYQINKAGEKLKSARAKMRDMIKQDIAVISDETSISKILLDYFNAKADELINKVKHENYGKLKQELADIYSLSDYYAKQANFTAQISKAYYEVRQAELKWASVLHTLRIEEKEQQRTIREQQREEERARKEYEKAIKDAAKEEAMLQMAMDKAKAAMEQANIEQKAKYEAQLAELAVKLKEAEEKNKRALSMAQQTRAGHVYLISNIGSFGDDMMKIGMTRRLEPLDRVRELGDASVPFLFDVHAIIYSEDAPALEKQLHQEFNHLRVNKVNYRKEFFRITPLQLKEKLSELGIQAQFTLAAEAAEYRETIRIESMDKSEQDKLLNSLLAQEIASNE